MNPILTFSGFGSPISLSRNLVLLSLLSIPFLNVQAQTREQSLSPENKQEIYKSMGNLPLSFIQNAGQWDESIRYQGTSPGWGANIYFLNDALSFGFSRWSENANRTRNSHSPRKRADKPEASEYDYLVWNLHFKGASPAATVTALEPGETHYNYLIGTDSTKFRRNVGDFHLVQYNNIYEGIDLKYYGSAQKLEYDFVLKPGADIRSIQMDCEGIKNLNITDQGKLEITTAWGSLLEEIPGSYQVVKGEKKEVKIHYRKIDEHTFGFSADETYDNNNLLVIDPISYAWGTFVGGAGGDGYISDITVDNAGNVYGTGWYNTAFPTTAGCYTHNAPGGGYYGDAYIFKLNPSASTLVWATYLGGASSYEQGEGIDVSATGEVYVTGWTQSNDFPTTAGAISSTFGGFQDVWVTHFNTTGTNLLYSTYVSGTYSDYAYALVLDAAGHAFVTGYSGSPNWPTTPGVVGPSTINSDAFVFELNTTGTAFLFNTFVHGGNANCVGYGLALDAAGNSYITGYTYGMTATTGAYQTTIGSAATFPDAFASKLDATGSTLIYNTFLGGDNWEEGNGITVDQTGNAYVTGFTRSANFPLSTGAYIATAPGTSGNFNAPWLLKLNPAGSGMIYSTFIATDGAGYSVQVNNAGETFVSGNL
ncbi:MAG TPA: SBBP repeat-containing protein, partial [Bacteroidia bacterium]|nr:SBBP repeat-containing protein [Bacteroidia bacterium]